MEYTGYSKGIKSFRKILIKSEKKGLIGRIKEHAHSHYFIYAKKDLISERDKKDPWRDYYVKGEDIDSIKFHWQTARLFDLLHVHKECTGYNSYINQEDSRFDFYFKLSRKRVLNYALYACIYDYWDADEEDRFFRSIKECMKKRWIDRPILLVRSWNEKFLKGFIEEGFDESPWMERIAWCHIEPHYKTKKDFLGAKVMTKNSKMTLREYIEGEAERMEEETEKRLQPKTLEEMGFFEAFWEAIKGTFDPD